MKKYGEVPCGLMLLGRLDCHGVREELGCADRVDSAFLNYSEKLSKLPGNLLTIFIQVHNYS